MGSGPERSAAAPIVPEQPLDFVRVIVAGDAMDANVAGFDRRLKYFFDTYQQRDTNHIIVDPSVAGQLKIDEAHGIIHQHQEANINKGIVGITNKYGPKRMVIFLAAHGANAGGALCYKSENSCTYTGHALHALINELDEANKRKNPEHQLNQLLIIPLSCYNKALADSLFAKLRSENFKSFAVVMSHMLAHGPEKSLGDISAPEAIFQGGFEVNENQNNQFNDWMNQHNRVDRLLSLSTLDEYITLVNEVMPNNHVDGNLQQSRISRFAAKQEDAVIKLSDFQVSMKHLTLNRMITDPPPGQLVQNQIYRASPQAIAHTLVAAPKLRALIVSLDEGVNTASYACSSPHFQLERDWQEESSFTVRFSMP